MGGIYNMLIVLERKKLYEEIWNIKMKDLAKSYGISEVSLRKYCRQLNVPFPQSGYWTKVRNGSNPKRIALPNFDGDNKIVIQRYEYNKKTTYNKDDRLKHMEEDEKNKVLEFCNNIKVPEKLYKPHSLLKEIKFYSDNRDMLRDGRAKNIDLKVSNELRSRAIRLMNTILKNLEALGFQIKSKDKDTRVCIGKEEVKIGLKEKLVRVEHIKTDKDSYWSPAYDYKYSGELTLFIDDYEAPRKNWRDLSNKKLEEMIGDFIITVIDTAEIIRVKKEKRAREDEVRRQQEIEKRKLKKRQEYDMKKIDELKVCAENYILSVKMEEYIRELEKGITNIIDNEKRDKICSYIEWAREKIEWLNPINQKHDELLGKKYNDNLYDVKFQDSDDECWW